MTKFSFNKIYVYLNFLKIKPSQYMFQMSLNTEQKLSNQHTMKVPLKTQLLDMAETSLQKVNKGQLHYQCI